MGVRKEFRTGDLNCKVISIQMEFKVTEVKLSLLWSIDGAGKGLKG